MADECLKAFQEVKVRRKYRYVVFGMNNKQDEITVERKCPVGEQSSLSPKEKYEKFLDILQKKQLGGNCCYALYDLNYSRSNGQPRQRMILISW